MRLQSKKGSRNGCIGARVVRIGDRFRKLHASPLATKPTKIRCWPAPSASYLNLTNRSDPLTEWTQKLTGIPTNVNKATSANSEVAWRLGR